MDGPIQAADQDVWLRVPLLFALDMTLNGFSAALIIRYFVTLIPRMGVGDAALRRVESTNVSSVELIDSGKRPEMVLSALFHPNRLDMKWIWHALTPIDFIVGSLMYLSVVLLLLVLCCLPHRRLVQFYRWIVPIAAAILALHVDFYVAQNLTATVRAGFVGWIAFSYLIALILLLNFVLFNLYHSDRSRRLPTLLSPSSRRFCWAVFYGVPLAAPLMVFSDIFRRIALIALEYALIPFIVLEFELVLSTLGALLASTLRWMRSVRRQDINIDVRLFFTDVLWRNNMIVSLRTLFVIRFLFNGVFLLVDRFVHLNDDLSAVVWSTSTYLNVSNTNSTYSMSTAGIAASYLAVRSSETAVGVLSSAAVVSDIGQFLTNTFMYILDSPQTDESDTTGTVLGVLFVMLALQSSITNVDPQKRLLRLYRGVVLQVTGLLHLFGRILDDSFQRVGAAGAQISARAALRVIGCALWVLFSIALLLWYLFLDVTGAWSSPWILSVSLFSLEVIMRILLSFVLFICNLRLNSPAAMMHPEQIDGLESKIFYTKMLSSIVELTIGVLLLLNGLFILATDYGGVIRLALMSLHAYGNVWLQGQELLSSWRRRKDADSKIDGLETVGGDELAVLDDKCTICQEDLVLVAKKTPCSHYFHAACLRRWLFVQDVCPNCHSLLRQPPLSQDVAAGL